MSSIDKIIEAYNRGYRVINNDVFSPNGKKLSLILCNGYPRFHIRLKGLHRNINVHRLVAYQKFGNKIFDSNIQVRHLDGDRTNFSESNIEIGTASQNQMDKTLQQRLDSANIATSYVKIHDHEAIRKRRLEGATYKEIMKEFNISSKGTVSFIINKKTF